MGFASVRGVEETGLVKQAKKLEVLAYKQIEWHSELCFSSGVATFIFTEGTDFIFRYKTESVD